MNFKKEEYWSRRQRVILIFNAFYHLVKEKISKKTLRNLCQFLQSEIDILVWLPSRKTIYQVFLNRFQEIATEEEKRILLPLLTNPDLVHQIISRKFASLLNLNPRSNLFQGGEFFERN